jgi:hypothetical protein
LPNEALLIDGLTHFVFADTLIGTIEICIDVDLGEYIFKRRFRELPVAVKAVRTRKSNGPASRICERELAHQ